MNDGECGGKFMHLHVNSVKNQNIWRMQLRRMRRPLPNLLMHTPKPKHAPQVRILLASNKGRGPKNKPNTNAAQKLPASSTLNQSIREMLIMSGVKIWHNHFNCENIGKLCMDSSGFHTSWTHYPPKVVLLVVLGLWCCCSCGSIDCRILASQLIWGPYLA